MILPTVVTKYMLFCSSVNVLFFNAEARIAILVCKLTVLL